jgi:hypothetical protein
MSEARKNKASARLGERLMQVTLLFESFICERAGAPLELFVFGEREWRTRLMGLPSTITLAE